MNAERPIFPKTQYNLKLFQIKELCKRSLKVQNLQHESEREPTQDLDYYERAMGLRTVFTGCVMLLVTAQGLF